MKYRYTGDGEITLRHMTFESGKPAEVSDELLAKKIAALPYFEEVRPGRKKKADGDSA